MLSLSWRFCQYAPSSQQCQCVTLYQKATQVKDQQQYFQPVQWAAADALVTIQNVFLHNNISYEQLLSILALLTTGPALSLLHLDGCLYLVRPGMLQAQTAQLCSDQASTTAFVTVDTHDDQSLAVASADAVRVRCNV